MDSQEGTRQLGTSTLVSMRGHRRLESTHDDAAAVLATNKRARLARKRHIFQSVSDKTSILEEDEDAREERVRETYDECLALGKHDQDDTEDGDENGDGDGDGDANEDEDGDEEGDEDDAEDGDEHEMHDQGSTSSVVSAEGAISDVGAFDEPPSLQAGRTVPPSALAPPFSSLTDVTPPLSEEDRVRLIAQVTVCSKITRSLYDSLQSMPGQRFREGSFPSSYKLRQILELHTNVKTVDYDMCLHGCRAYTGPHENDTMCRCGESRLNNRGTPQAVFHYLPLIHQLQPMYRNRDLAMKLAYPERRTCEASVYSDIFDGAWYKVLRKNKVVWDRKVYEQRYFTEVTDLALSLGIDGIQCFVRNSVDCWPIIITLYSLSPELRHRQEYRICCGVIAGNRDISGQREFDIDSFLQPLIDELKILATDGVETTGWAYNPVLGISEWKTFRLRAHLLTISGDMPAIAKVMHFKGHNGKYPCRCCSLPATRVSKDTPYYMAHRTKDSLTKASYTDLPPRTHEGIQQRAYAIETALTQQEANSLSRESGIQGQAALSVVGSVSFPWSFPLDLMHVLYENIMKQLLKLWEGDYKLKVINGDAAQKLVGSYVISAANWTHIDIDTARSTKMVPAQMAPYLKSVTKRSFWNADCYSYFLMHLGPIVLRDRLDNVYYQHFIDLSKLAIVVTQPTITEEELEDLEKGFVTWVMQFEELYYTFDPKFMPVCTAPIHALLHVAQYIRQQGPPCQYWCFYIERFGAYIKRQVVRNKKKPFETLHNRLVIEQRLHQLIMQLDNPSAIIEWRARVSPAALDWSTATAEAEVDTHPPYRGRLSEKEKPGYQLQTQALRALKRYLEAEAWTFERQRSKTLFTCSEAQLRLLAQNVESWRMFRATSDNGRYIIRTGRSLNEGEKRNASWIRYKQYEDKQPSNKTIDAAWVPVYEWGEVMEFLTFQWHGGMKCVCVIQPAFISGNWLPGKLEGEGPQLMGSKKLPLQVVDLTAIVTVAGRVPLSGTTGTVIFDISNGLLDPDEVVE